MTGNDEQLVRIAFEQNTACREAIEVLQRRHKGAMNVKAIYCSNKTFSHDVEKIHFVANR